MTARSCQRLRMDVPVFMLLFHLNAEIRVLLASRLEEGCPLGHFPCGNMSECLPQVLQCNGHTDCPNGADEQRCGDNAGWAELFGQSLQNDGAVERDVLSECRKCVLHLRRVSTCVYPQSCDCIQTDVECVALGLQEVPQVSPNVTWLSLRGNKIQALSSFVLAEYAHLERLFLQNNSLHFISQHAFSGLRSLKKL
ncbi:Relaxin receptor 1 [Takifugu flavidus]|uniref:Relaxin receptor 1 n=1 Tax=Takifugu flavidus TaxID=433684 RepID=A0A5C6P4C8_9TELE|nr:Relaxin receptor 1 [Takifugu flavidus]